MALVFQQATATDSAGTSCTCTHGLTIPDGAVVFVTGVEDAGDADLAIDDSGWTAIAVTTGNGCGQTGWVKIASTEPSSYTISNKAGGNEMRMAVVVVSGDAGETFTIDDHDSNSSAGDQASLTSATLDTQNNGFTIYAFGNDTGPSNGRTVSVAPTGTELVTWVGAGVGIGVWYKTGLSAGTDSNSITFNAADGVNCVCVAAHYTAAGGQSQAPRSMHQARMRRAA